MKRVPSCQRLVVFNSSDVTKQRRASIAMVSLVNEIFEKRKNLDFFSADKHVNLMEKQRQNLVFT